jgi:hypothetical protein
MEGIIMALSASEVQGYERFAPFGVIKQGLCNITFDSSYASGGEGTAPIKSEMGMSTIHSIQCEGTDGYQFEYDSTNEKLKVKAPAPPIVYEEKQTIASNSVTLDYPAALIMNIVGDDATPPGTAVHQIMVDRSATMGANQCQLSAAMSVGARPTIDFHASTSGDVYVTYITQAWAEVWTNRTRETLTTSTHVASSTNVFIAVESLHGSHAATDVTNFEYVRGGDAAGSGECEIDFTDAGNSNLTTFTFNAADAITAAIPTGIIRPSAGFLLDRWLEDQDNTMSSGASAAITPNFGILFQSTCGQLPDYHAAAERDPHNLQVRAGDALGTAGEFYIRYETSPATGITGHITANDTTSDAVSLSYVYGNVAEIPGIVPLEVPSSIDLSSLVVRALVIGE